MPNPPSAFDVVTSGVLHEDAPHHLRRHREKMRTVLPLHLFVVHQSRIRFVDQGGGLQAVAWPLAAHVMASQAPELVVNDRRQAVECARIPRTPGAEQIADISAGSSFA